MTDKKSVSGVDYSIVIAPGLLAELPVRLRNRYPGRHMVVLTDNRVWDLYGAGLADDLASLGLATDDIVVPEGESSKSLDTYSAILEELHHHRFDEDSLLINLGGGVIRDLGGFVAASYRQGVSTVHIPTTLLAQQEAAFGTRAGINTNWCKNSIGTTSRPDAVYVDSDVLQSLSRRDLACGLAASVRIAVCGSDRLFCFIEAALEQVLDESDAHVMHQLVLQASSVWLSCVDEPGRGLGLPFAHALEAACRFGGVLHGEALAWGLVMSTALARLQGLTDDLTVGRIFNLLAACGLPPHLPQHVAMAAIDHLDLGSDGAVALPVGIGRVVMAPRPDVHAVYEALEWVQRHPAFADLRTDLRDAA